MIENPSEANCNADVGYRCLPLSFIFFALGPALFSFLSSQSIQTKGNEAKSNFVRVIFQMCRCALLSARQVTSRRRLQGAAGVVITKVKFCTELPQKMADPLPNICGARLETSTHVFPSKKSKAGYDLNIWIGQPEQNSMVGSNSSHAIPRISIVSH